MSNENLLPHFLRLLEYNFWANDQLIKALQSQAEPRESTTVGMNKLLKNHRNWIENHANRGTLNSMWDVMNPNTWEAQNVELYNESTDILKTTTLQKIINYKSQDFETNCSMEDSTQHLVFSSELLRSSLIDQMKSAQIIAPPCDYLYYCKSYL